MQRCWCQWKKCLCVLVLTAIVAQLLYTVTVTENEPTPASARFSSYLLLPTVPGHSSSQHGHPKVQYDPFHGDHEDKIGLKGLQTFDCVRAIEGSPVKSAARFVPLSDQAFSERIVDCPTFMERYGYNRYPPVSEEEKQFPIAFNILLYKEVEQVHVLLRAIYRPHNSYCLHVDGYAAPQVFEATQRLAACVPNVFLASRRENVTYAGFSRLQADINCMQDHWHRSSKQSLPWRYLINLPSQQFPLKTNLEMVKILKIYNGSNDIEGITGNRMLRDRFTFKHVYRPEGSSGRIRLVRTREKLEAPAHKIQVVKGSAYGVFSRDFVRYVLHEQIAQDLLEWCRSVQSPDEYFWATLHHNNPHLHVPGSYNGSPDQKPWLAVYASWPPRDSCESGRSVRGVCIFGVQDLPQLVTRRELFANKFYMDFQPEAVHCLDQWIFNKTRAALPFDTLYYKQLPFVKH